jgi:CheY-like chemotaxis protein
MQKSNRIRPVTEHEFRERVSSIQRDVSPLLIEAALKAGNAAIVVATESHQDSLLLRLQAHGLDILVVDDYERFRRIVCSTLGKRRDLQVIGEASDGLEALGLLGRLALGYRFCGVPRPA